MILHAESLFVESFPSFLVLCEFHFLREILGARALLKHSDTYKHIYTCTTKLSEHRYKLPTISGVSVYNITKKLSLGIKHLGIC